MSDKSHLKTFWEWVDLSGKRQAAADRDYHEETVKLRRELIKVNNKLAQEREAKQLLRIARACCNEMERRGLVAREARDE
jgi:hypothetical protein